MEESNKARTQEFYTRFSASRTDITSRLDAVKAAGQPDIETLNTLSTDVAKLRKELIDATSFLPSYDQRQYEEFLKAMEVSLETLRVASARKPKFAFRRKAAKDAPKSAKEPPITQPVSQDDSLAVQSSHLLLSGHTNSYLDLASLNAPGLSTDLTISDLDRCLVNLLPLRPSDASHDIRFTALHIRNLKDTALVLPVINGSALLHDLQHCTIVLGCHQFRMHTSQRVDVYLSIESNPIIEHCSAVRFAHYPSALSAYPNLPVVPRETSKHLSVQDFSHIRQTPSPNWSDLTSQEPSAEKWLAVTRVMNTNGDEWKNSTQQLLPP